MLICTCFLCNSVDGEKAKNEKNSQTLVKFLTVCFANQNVPNLVNPKKVHAKSLCASVVNLPLKGENEVGIDFLVYKYLGV